ncbi:MAG: hypothetical protein E7376_02540 [Clostridiales bacterium]|nr:hypothetical protein [Clostridiales bacterium]
MEEVINELDQLANEYLALKDEKGYYVMTLCERTKTFLNITKDAEYSKAGLARVDEIKELFFNNQTFERLGLGKVENYFGTFKVADKYGKEIKYIVVVNPEGFKKGESFASDKLYMFELSLKDHTIDRVSPESVKKYFSSGAYELVEEGQKLENLELNDANEVEEQVADYDCDFISVEESFEDYMFDGVCDGLEH